MKGLWRVCRGQGKVGSIHRAWDTLRVRKGCLLMVWGWSKKMKAGVESSEGPKGGSER